MSSLMNTFFYLSIFIFIAFIISMLSQNLFYNPKFLNQEPYTNLGDIISDYPQEKRISNNNNSINGSDNTTMVHNSPVYGSYPFPNVDGALVSESYPITHKNGVSNYQEQMMWWHFPVFKVGSYEQITNNLKYPNNPDVGQCMPAEFCGTLYKEYQTDLNEAQVLPPVTPSCNGTRINYYNTAPNMLPYKTQDGINILY
jgi:hypothetical protein